MPNEGLSQQPASYGGYQQQHAYGHQQMHLNQGKPSRRYGHHSKPSRGGGMGDNSPQLQQQQQHQQQQQVDDFNANFVDSSLNEAAGKQGGKASTSDRIKRMLASLTHAQLIDLLALLGATSTTALNTIKAVCQSYLNKRKLFVRELAWETTSAGLKVHFEQFGEVIEAAVVMDKQTNRSRGFGFVTFSTEDSAELALRQPAMEIDGRLTFCNLAIEGNTRRKNSDDFGANGNGGAGPAGMMSSILPSSSSGPQMQQQAQQQQAAPHQYGQMHNGLNNGAGSSVVSTLANLSAAVSSSFGSNGVAAGTNSSFGSNNASLAQQSTNNWMLSGASAPAARSGNGGGGLYGAQLSSGSIEEQLAKLTLAAQQLQQQQHLLAAAQAQAQNQRDFHLFSSLNGGTSALSMSSSAAASAAAAASVTSPNGVGSNSPPAQLAPVALSPSGVNGGGNISPTQLPGLNSSSQSAQTSSTAAMAAAPGGAAAAAAFGNGAKAGSLFAFQSQQATPAVSHSIW